MPQRHAHCKKKRAERRRWEADFADKIMSRLISEKWWMCGVYVYLWWGNNRRERIILSA